MLRERARPPRGRKREKRLNAPQREDERLTSPTLTASLNKLSLGLSDPDRANRVAEKAARFKVKEELKKEERRNALHTLYMNAREFITTEKQLVEEIDKVFVPSPFGKDYQGQENIWDAFGAPPTAQEMFEAFQGRRRGA